MKHKSLFLIPVLALSFFCSCKKCPCGPAEGLLPAFIGYTEAQTDTLILRRYANTGNFNQLMDTLLINQPLLGFTRNNDTLSPSYNSISIPMVEGNDYEIAVPAINKTYRITGIVEVKNSMACGGIFSMDKRYCVNPVDVYYINGEKTKPIPYGRFVYLR